MEKFEKKLLYRSFEQALTEQEAEQLRLALIQSPALRAEKEELEKLRALFGEQTFSFEPFFVGKLMHRLEQRPVDSPLMGILGSWNLAFSAVAIPGILLILVLLGHTYFTESTLSLAALAGIEDMPIDDLMTSLLVSI